MVLLDTDILVDLLRNDVNTINIIKDLESKKTKFYTTTINTFELFKGAYLSSKKEENIKLIYQLLENLEIIPFDYNASRLAGKISYELTKTGSVINIGDQMIGAIALLNNEIIATKNVNHFKKIPCLKLKKW